MLYVLGNWLPMAFDSGKDLGKRSTVFEYFQRWTDDRTLESACMIRFMSAAAIWLDATPSPTAAIIG